MQLRGDEVHYFVKQPNEILPISMDFVDLLDDNETITSKSIIAYDSSNADVTSTIIAASSILGTKIKITARNGTTTNQYKITIRATTSNGNLYEEDIYMKVLEN